MELPSLLRRVWSTAPAHPWPAWPAAAITMLAAALWFALIADSPPLHQDTIRDLLTADDCRRGLGCMGPPTSMRGVQQSPGWTWLLAALLPDVQRMHQLSVLAHGAAVAAMAWTLAPHLSRPVLLGVVALAMPWQLAATDFPNLWGPTLTALPLALFFAGLMRAQESRRELARCGAASLAAASLGVAIHGHLVHALGAPLLVVGCSLAPHPRRTLLVAAVTFLTVAQPWRFAGIAYFGWALGAVVLATFVGMVALRRSASATALERQRVLALAGLLLAGGVLAASTVGHQFAERYVALGLLPALLGIGLALDALRSERWRAALAAVLMTRSVFLAVGAHWLVQTSMQDRLGFEEAQALRARLPGTSLEGLLLRLEGERVWELLSAMVVFGMPALGGVAPPHTLRVVNARDEVEPLLRSAGWTRVTARRGSGLWMSETEGWPRLAQARVCGAGGVSCGPSLQERPWRPPGTMAHSLTYLSFEAWNRGAPAAQTDGNWLLEIPLDAPEAQERTLIFTDSRGWFRFVRVEGLPHRGQLPGPCVVLQGPGRGKLVVEAIADRNPPMFTPNWLEFRADETSLRDAIVRGEHDRSEVTRILSACQ